MFNTTHDAILLGLALLYLVVAVMRHREVVAMAAARIRTTVPNGYLFAPIAISIALFVTAVLW